VRDGGSGLNSLLVLDGTASNGSVGVGNASPSSKLDVSGNIEIGSSDYFYLGDPNTNGSWRFHRYGDNLRFERRENTSWIDKGGFNA
jgi:hypothetical protein